MEGAREVVEVERDPVRLVRFRRRLDHPGKLRDALDHVHLRLVTQNRKVGLPKLFRLEKSTSGNASAACRNTEAQRAWAYWT